MQRLEDPPAVSLRVKSQSAWILKEERGITGARGLAALYVFLGHFFFYSGFSPNLITNVIVSGSSGVDFFFVLSAYLLTKKLSRGDYKSMAAYYARRVFRIWPTYFIAATAFVVSGLMPFQPLTYVFLVNYFPSTFLAYPIWTLLIEELFYLILPLWVLGFAKGRWKVALPVILAYEVVFRVLTQPYLSTTSYYNWSFESRVFDYALGTVLGLGISLRALKAFSSKGMRKVLKLATILAFIFAGETTGWNDAWYTPILYSAIYYCALSFFADSPFFKNRVSYFLGKISYSWYLYGWGITYWLFLNSYLTTSPVQAIAWGVVIFGGSVVLSYASYRYLERPIMRFGRSLFERRDPITRTQI